jgi:lipid A disaccharide synthetase
LVQSALRSERLVGLSRELLANTQERERMRDAFADIRRKLGGPGGSVRAAEAVLQELR